MNNLFTKKEKKKKDLLSCIQIYVFSALRNFFCGLWSVKYVLLRTVYVPEHDQ